MTNREKIDLLKSTIEFLYTKEGRPKSYIARLLEIDRRILTYAIKEWGIVQGNTSYLSPSNQKFANKHRNLIKSRLDSNVTQKDIAKELQVTPDYLINIINKDTVMPAANQAYKNRKKAQAETAKQSRMDNSSVDYTIKCLPNEQWVEIMGHDGYYISNCGRVKHYIRSYNAYRLLTTHNNCVSNRLYVTIGDNNLQVSRLVGFAFVGGHSIVCNTINHIDGDVTNNVYSNLEWVSQKVNNEKSYVNGRDSAVAFSKHKKFKSIIVDGKYEFKTIRAMAKFMGVSETQAHRYIDGESNSQYNIKFIY